jgi:nitroimidazol reductase NimA-like FMN-containing flavoprotein (pyridoxamine 5'-phosphate oxidase superfamily)
MTQQEIDSFLIRKKTCRVATVDAGGNPHVSPLWFVWDGTSVWLNSIIRSQRWVDIQRDPRIAVVVDGGDGFTELHGVEIRGTAEKVGDVPRGSGRNNALTDVGTGVCPQVHRARRIRR